MKRIFLWIFYCFLGLYSIPANAQSTKVDSVITLLQKSNRPTGVDTAIFQSALNVFRNDALTDADIRKLDAEADRFTKGNNEDTGMVIRIYTWRYITDVNKSIDYGMSLVERIEKRKSPNSDILINTLLSGLRVPFRNSGRLSEGLFYYNNRLIKFKEQNDSAGIALCSFVLGGFYRSIGLFNRSIYHFKKSLSFSDSNKTTNRIFFKFPQYGDRGTWINNLRVIGDTYTLTGDLKNGIIYCRRSLESRQQIGGSIVSAAQGLAYQYFLAERLDSATYLVNLAYDSSKNNKISKYYLPPLYQTWSLLELKKNNFSRADSLLTESWKIIQEMDIPANPSSGITDPDYYRALIRIKQKKYAEAAGFLINDIARIKNLRYETLRDYKLLGEVYDKMGDAVKSKETYKAFISLQDSLLADQSKYSAISFEAEQQMNEKELSINQLQNENKVSSLTRNFSYGIIALVLLLAGVIYYRYKAKQKANTVLEKTLTDLKSTQTQLIQSEKMASLGELTAGIAHEIQNPLNFVNNFSEVTAELVDEMEEAILKSDREEIISISSDIKDNLQKIVHHGKRADAIVKGMLQHSRSTGAVKEPTDINALCDEYFRLTYHGLRAKDKSFNATIKTDFDESIGKINIIPQDIGRVILNLLTNAFYVVNEKKHASTGSARQPYEPTVSISTKKIGDKAEIRVKDNGNGIPQKVLDKIFQPFFTTKPTGQGTGLGLSLSYDIVTKGHGGELKVETKEGEGSEFILNLPI